MQLEDYKNSNSNKRKLLLAIFGIVAVFILVFIAVFLFLKNYFPANVDDKEDSQVTAVKQINCDQDSAGCVRRSIDGEYVESGKENTIPIAVMIENHTDARPQSGLSKANLVFEAEAEGSITRFLAVFADGRDIKEIGPVRSARPYYIDWADELSAVYVHCGGSPEALQKIARKEVIDLNEFYYASYFWRDQLRLAPHNLYTSTEKLGNFIKANNLENKGLETWKYKDDLKLEERTESPELIKINYKLPDFVIEWKYDRVHNEYLRYMAGKPHQDKDGSQIKAKNIIIQKVSAKVIDDQARLDMENVGKGSGAVCLDGKCREITWIKKDIKSRTKFYLSAEEEMEFNAGTTWVEVVSPVTETIYNSK